MFALFEGGWWYHVACDFGAREGVLLHWASDQNIWSGWWMCICITCLKYSRREVLFQPQQLAAFANWSSKEWLWHLSILLLLLLLLFTEEKHTQLSSGKSGSIMWLNLLSDVWCNKILVWQTGEGRVIGVEREMYSPSVARHWVDPSMFSDGKEKGKEGGESEWEEWTWREESINFHAKIPCSLFFPGRRLQPNFQESVNAWTVQHAKTLVTHCACICCWKSPIHVWWQVREKKEGILSVHVLCTMHVRSCDSRSHNPMHQTWGDPKHFAKDRSLGEKHTHSWPSELTKQARFCVENFRIDQ